MIAPFLIWIFIFRGFLSGRISFIHDVPSYYFKIKYYFDCLAQGTFPFWNPFDTWGAVDNLDMRVFGEGNPFLYIIGFLRFLGVPFLKAYLAYLSLYFWIGLAGFYLLALRIFKNKHLAYIAYISLMFSSLGPTLFTDHVVMMTIVPSIWFFFFAILWKQDKNNVGILGMTFSLMIIAITYIPFYFLTVSLSMLTVGLLVYTREIKNSFLTGIKDLYRKKMLIAFCLTAVLVAVLPHLMWFLSSQQGEMAMDFRHSNTPSKNLAAISLEVINKGSIAHILCVPKTLLSYSFINIEHITFFYVPFFLFLILGISLFNKTDKFSSFLVGCGLILFYIALGALSGVHKFLYNHVFFFRYFRNLHFFLYFLLPFVILFCVQQLKIFVENLSSSKKTGLTLIFLIFIHLLFLIFILKGDFVFYPSYITVFMSLSFFSFAIFFKPLHDRPQHIYSIAVIVLLLHPLCFFHNFQKISHPKPLALPQNKTKTAFHYTRPLKGEDYSIKNLTGVQSQAKVLEDKSGFLPRDYMGQKWCYFLHKNIPHKALREYVRHKFIIYDKTRYQSDDDLNLNQLAGHFYTKENIALVNDPAAERQESIFSQGELPRVKAQFIKENSPAFQVVHFEPNSIRIKTNLPKAKFLVYNDAYHKDWHVFINGKEKPLYRANIAFKGIWLDPGENLVEFRFGGKGLKIFYISFIIFFFAFLLLLCKSAWSFYVTKKTIKMKKHV